MMIFTRLLFFLMAGITLYPTTENLSHILVTTLMVPDYQHPDHTIPVHFFRESSCQSYEIKKRSAAFDQTYQAFKTYKHDIFDSLYIKYINVTLGANNKIILEVHAMNDGPANPSYIFKATKINENFEVHEDRYK